MNRTAAFLLTAAGLALVAVVLGLPSKPAAPPPPPKVETTAAHLPPEPPKVTAPAPAVASNGSLKMKTALSHPYVGTGRSDVFLTVDMNAVTIPGERRAPVNLALVIDRSGSMAGVKLARAKQAARALLEQLGPEDRLAIVHYGSDVRALPAAHVDEASRARMRRYIDGIFDDGGTNIGAGLQAGRRQLASALGQFKVNRLVLVSDGQPTEGVTSESALARMAQNIRAEGISVSAIGVGDDFNEDLMQRISELGSGSYAYLQDASQLATIFQKDLQQAGTTVAQDVGLSLSVPSSAQISEVLGYRIERRGDAMWVPLPDFAAGQVERVVVRLSVDGPAPGQIIDVASVRLSYRDLLADRPVETASHLAATVTDRQEEVLARRDKSAYVQAVRAQSGVNFRKAAELAAKGDRDEARRVLRENFALFDEAEAVGGGGAVAADRLENEQAFGLMQGPSASAPSTVKQLKRQSLKSFGRGESVY